MHVSWPRSLHRVCDLRVLACQGSQGICCPMSYRRAFSLVCWRHLWLLSCLDTRRAPWLGHLTARPLLCPPSLLRCGSGCAPCPRGPPCGVLQPRLRTSEWCDRCGGAHDTGCELGRLCVRGESDCGARGCSCAKRALRPSSVRGIHHGAALVFVHDC